MNPKLVKGWDGDKYIDTFTCVYVFLNSLTVYGHKRARKRGRKDSKGNE